MPSGKRASIPVIKCCAVTVVLPALRAASSAAFESSCLIRPFIIEGTGACDTACASAVIADLSHESCPADFEDSSDALDFFFQRLNIWLAYTYTMKVQIRRSSRAKRMAIHVEASGDVELVLPKRASESAGRAFLEERKDWINQVLKKQQSTGTTMPVTELKDGGLLPFFGDSLVLSVYVEPDRARSFVEEKGGKVIARISAISKLRLAIARFYIAQAKQYFIGQSHEYGQIIGKKIPRVRVIDMKTQWGSCNHRTHTLTFNWRLALAPEHVARYVTAHEVAHIIHANHSMQFWKAVEQLYPQYATSRAWLKKFGGSLRIQI